jgi:hypothetical protein
MGKLVPKGTEVQVIPLDDPRVINKRINPDSYIMLVQFPDMDHPTYVHVDQIEL